MEEEFELQRTFQRDINCLLDEDRNLRRKGLNSLVQGLFKNENSDQDIHNLFKKTLLKSLLKVISDKVEKHREISIQILDKFFERVPNIDGDLVSSILKEITMRLRDNPFPEQSEEIRLALVHLLMKIFSKGYTQAFNQNLSEIMYTISKILTDTFADIKKDASLFIITLSHGLKDTVGVHSNLVIKALAKNLGHQHSKVRKVTIESLGELLLTREAGYHLKEVMLNFKIIVNDKTSEVRKSTYQIVGKLLNQFSPSLLREFESDLVQLLLNGLSDDNEEIIKVCQNLIEEVGQNIKALEADGMKDENGNNVSE